MPEPRGNVSRRRFIIGSAALVAGAAGTATGVALFTRKSTRHTHDYLTEQARSLGFKTDRIVAFVRDTIQSDSYDGVLRGALGTLWSGAGNDLDRALLLQALLDRAGTHAALVRGQTYGVEIDGKYVGPARPSDAGARPLPSIPDEQYHTVRIAIQTAMGSAQPVESARTYRIADLIGAEPFLFYRKAHGRTITILTVSGKELTDQSDAASARRQELVFTFSGPANAAARYSIQKRRELFTQAYAEYRSQFHPANRYALIISAGFVQSSVFRAEGESAKAFRNKVDAVNHLIAYGFLSRSDENTKRLMADEQVNAWFASPRLTIVSSETATISGQGHPVVSIDLRKNDIAVDKPGLDSDTLAQARVAFATNRSLYDASIEPAVLTARTGAQAISAAILLANAAERRRSSLSERQRLLTASLQRLLDEAHDGARLRVGPEAGGNATASPPPIVAGPGVIPAQGADIHYVQYQYDAAHRAFHVSVADAVRMGLSKTNHPTLSILNESSTYSSDVDRIAQDTEIALALSIGLPADYVQWYEYTPEPEAQWYTHARIFEYDYSDANSPRIGIETVYDVTSSDLVANIVNYWDIDTHKYKDDPDRASITTRKEDVQSAHDFTTWYRYPTDNKNGRTWSMFSRDVYTELKRDGFTKVRFLDRDGNVSDTLVLWLIESKQWPILYNGKIMEVSVLIVNGDYEKNRPQKPTGATFAPIYDPTDPDTAINYWTVLDDPQMPIFFEYTLYPGTQSVHVQSSIPGRVVDSVALRGVANADVSIDGLDVVARSWPDGTFVLPLIDEPYREFSLSVKAPQYADLTTKRDFRAADAFPVALTMERTVDAGHPNYIVICQGTLEKHAADLRERLTGRSADIISEALQSDHGLIVLIPTFDVYGPFGKADAWLEVNMRTCEIYGRLMDGLYGGTIEPPPPYAGQQGAVEYFMGNTAGWYLVAAGALTAVNVAIEVPSITNDEMYKVAMLAAERMEEEIYNVAGFEGAESFGEVSDIVASVLSGELSAIPAAVGTAVVGSKAFEAGLKRGLGTMAKAMKRAWGVGGSGG